MTDINFYNNSYIYKIYLNEDDKNINFYIGSTCSFISRFINHKHNVLKKNTILYNFIRENGGDFIMEKIHNVNCNNEYELHEIEQVIYDKLKPNLNMSKPSSSNNINENTAYTELIDNDDDDIIKLDTSNFNPYNYCCIYKIYLNDDDKDSNFYIGSTINYIDRIKTHKKDALNKQQNLYKSIRGNGDIFYIEKLYNFKCNNDTEKTIEERKAYDNLKPTLNMVRPFVSKEEAKETTKIYNEKNKEKKKDYCKDYYENNKDVFKEKTKLYREDNRVIIRQKDKEYYDANKEKKKKYQQENQEQRKAYYQNNKECISENQKIYREANSDMIKLKRRERFEANAKIIVKCECGFITNKNNLTPHKKSKKHIKLMRQNNV